MKISIVVPVYNAEKFLEECIESVLNQTNSNWELVLVDDGSTDKSASICDAFAREYPNKIFVFHKQNGGEFSARQYGIEKCSGEYIGFLDADDLLDNAFVEVINQSIVLGDLIDVICFNFARFNEQGIKKYSNIRTRYLKTNSDMNLLYTQIASGELVGAMWSKVFRTNLLKTTPINEKLVSQKKFGPDAFHSFTMLFNAKSVNFIDDILYYYRDNPQGASVGYGKRDFDYFNTKYIFELIEDFLLKKCSSDDISFKKLYAHNFNAMVDHMLKFYRNSNTWKRKREIVEYDWQSYLLNETVRHIENNEFVRPSYKKVWKAFSKKKHIEICVRERFKRFIGW